MLDLIHVKSHAFSVRVTLHGIKSRSHAHPIILTLTQKSTNRKISVNMMKLPKQNWFVKYGNSDLLAIYFKYISVTSAYLTHNSIKEPE